MIRENNNNLSGTCQETSSSLLMSPDTDYVCRYIIEETQYAALKRDGGGVT